MNNLEDLFLAALLQDVGILVSQCFDQSLYNIDKDISHSQRIEVEEQLFNLDHAYIGAWLLESWNLPKYLIKSVRFSHTLNINEPEESQAERCFHYCLSFSGNLADVWLNDNPSELLLSLFDVIKNTLKMSNEELNEFIVDVDNLLPEMSSMFDISLISNEEREKVLYEARELLLERSIAFIKQSEDDRRYIDSITQRVEKIEEESRLDYLTKVYNRKYIDALLEDEFKNSNINKWPLSLAFIDVDDFKLINDTYGHLVGDDILKMISTFFSENIRESDVLARYGGDEFLLMLPGADLETAKSILERLLPLLEKAICLDVKNVTLSSSVSIGLATYTDKSGFSNLNDFISAADEALYEAKSGGKNCLAVYSS